MSCGRVCVPPPEEKSIAAGSQEGDGVAVNYQMRRRKLAGTV
jgi:hypothetical protein